LQNKINSCFYLFAYIDLMLMAYKTIFIVCEIILRAGSAQRCTHLNCQSPFGWLSESPFTPKDRLRLNKY